MVPLQEFLRDRNKVQKLVQSVDPLVRAVDGIAGERVSMRVIFFICVKSSAKGGLPRHQCVVEF